MRKRGVVPAAVLGLVAVGLLPACGAEEDTSDAGAANDSATTSQAPTGSAETPATSAKDAKQEITPPGTELKLGETATIPYTYGSSKGTIGITVTEIEKGSEADLADFENAEGLVPYFVKFTVENVGGTDLSFSTVDLQPVAANGELTGVFVTGDIEGKCVTASAEADFKTAGASYESCSVVGSWPGVDVVGAAYNRDDYAEKPIVWKK
ncbi:hypothetical protein [Saccharomonospora glauca]|uniref:DUF4352 domain-containing protein n=1 Tax=Saccharomonospora glauca K62 TaxID=928724 RepID=I1D2B0_9PSEU|nr:hypothetical protein [Saccharomonospora glauca]EIE99084.1 hypothetical protein SacglDRAFT_02185 [Saccharomonospora glauca K62]